MPYKTSKFIFFFSMVACVGLRIYLKLSYIDPDTGFYTDEGQLFAIAYGVILGVSCIAVIITALFSHKNTSTVYAAYPNQVRGMAALAGIVALPVAGLSAFAQFSYMADLDFPGPVVVGALMLLLRLICLAAAPVVSAVLFIYIGFKGTGDSRTFRINGLLMLVPLIWQVANLLTSYMSYTAIRSVSDQRYTVVMLILLVPFLLAYGRVMGGVNPEKGMRQMTAFGLSFAIVALSVSAGILAAPFFGKATDIAISLSEAGFYFCLGLYAAALCMNTESE